MKRFLYWHRPNTASLILLGLLVSSLALAVIHTSSVYAETKCGGVETSILSCDEEGGETIWSLLLIVINVMAGLVGIAAIGGFVYAAILYTSAGDKSAQVTKAKETLANVVIGLVLFALMWGFIQFLIPGGVFRDYSAPEVKNAPTARTVDTGDAPTGGGSGGSGGDIQGPVTPSAIKINNFRDASTTTNGKVLKPGVLYRSVELHNIGKKKQENISKLLGSSGLIVDLRLKEAVAAKPDPAIDGVKNVNIPIGGKYETAEFVDNGDMNTQFGKTLKTLANAPGPVWVHCVSGKDRTGWTVAMIMYAAGANDKQVKKEYAESTKFFNGKGGKQYHDPNWINSGVAKVKRNYGSILGEKGYLIDGLGLTQTEVSKLKSKFGA